MWNDLTQSMGRNLTVALALLCAAPAWAAPMVKTEHVEAELVTEKLAAQPGKPATVGLKLRMADAWHTYWKNPGDSGLPTRIQWVLPEGWKAGPIQWPYPKPLPIGPLMNYGYEDEVLLVSEITPAAGATAMRYPIRAKAEWLVCKDVCIPEQGELDLVLAVSPKEPATDERVAHNFERARNQLPVETSGWKFESAMTGKTLAVRMTPPAGSNLPDKIAFFPERELLIEPAAPQKVTREGNAARIEMKLADPPLTGVTSVTGVAVSDSGWPGTPRKAIAVDAPVGAALAAAGPVAAAPPPPAAAQANNTSTLAALVFAFIGGVLLNLMPCVFPVL